MGLSSLASSLRAADHPDHLPDMQELKAPDLIALGFLTFALFLGAGNIIFPPMVGLNAGEHLWLSALGFLLTAVGLPLMTVVALARVGGGLEAMTAPIGRSAGLLLGVVVYLTIGPLFAIPRTAMVSFEMGFAPFFGNGAGALMIYTGLYFALVILTSLFPGKLVESVGKLMTPALIVALMILGGAAFILPAGGLSEMAPPYKAAPLTQGFLQGYQTLDALGALVFGIIIVNAIRDHRVVDRARQTRYAIIASLIAAAGLALVYLSLIYLGATSGHVAPHASTGVQILTNYVEHTFGLFGKLLLAVVILLACITTAIGLTCACGEYFSRWLPVSYRAVVIGVCLFSLGISNQGLEQLIAWSIPVLVSLYPIAITLVILSLLDRLWISPQRVFIPTLLVAVLFGLIDGARATSLAALLPDEIMALPGAESGLSWFVPVLGVLAISATWDRMRGPLLRRH